MTFSCSLKTQDDVAFITLSGELDAASAPQFKSEIEKAKTTPSLRHLVLQMKGLNFMASAGLRGLVFAKQKMPDVEIYIIAAQETILDSLEKSGFNQSVIIMDEYPEG